MLLRESTLVSSVESASRKLENETFEATIFFKLYKFQFLNF